MSLSQLLKAAIWMAGAMLSFSLMAISGREFASDLNTFEIMFFHSLFGLVIVLQIGFFVGSLSQIKTNQLWLHLLYNTAHFTGQNL